MRKFLLFATFAALLSLPAAAGAASPQLPENGKERQSLSTAQVISEQEKLAGAGNTDAQYRLGEMLFQNHSIVSAKKWLEKAAANGNLLAEARLFYIRFCSGQKSDSTKQFNKFEKLAELDSDDAKILLGDFYLAGCGVTKDRRRAIVYFTSAAQNGDPRAQVSLALEEVETPERSFEKIGKIAEQGYAQAQTVLGFYYEKGKGTPKDPQKAVFWYQKAAKQNYAPALYNLGLNYETGTGVPKDSQKAFTLVKQAAEQGYAPAQNSLGFYYESGKGTPKNPQKAFIWYHKAAEQGNVIAQANLGFCYQDGTGTPKDPRKAFLWFQKAAEQGDTTAQVGLGIYYENGIGMPKDPQQAFTWYQKAAEQGDANAQSSLGLCYENGIGVPKDLQKAVFWYQKAAGQGDEFAQKKLQELR